MAHLHTFQITKIKDGKEYTKNILKFCTYPKKTKLYKSLIYLLDNNEITEFKIF